MGRETSRQDTFGWKDKGQGEKVRWIEHSIWKTEPAQKKQTGSRVHRLELLWLFEHDNDRTQNIIALWVRSKRLRMKNKSENKSTQKMKNWKNGFCKWRQKFVERPLGNWRNRRAAHRTKVKLFDRRLQRIDLKVKNDRNERFACVGETKMRSSEESER